MLILWISVVTMNSLFPFFSIRRFVFANYLRENKYLFT